MEFKVREVIPLAKTGGAGNLVISEVLMIHLHESILDEEGLIDQEKIDLVARLGASWYSRVTPESLFKVDKPLRRMGMGVDRLPEDRKRVVKGRSGSERVDIVGRRHDKTK